MKTISQSDIDRINELHCGIKRASARALKDALEIGDFFVKAHEKKGIRKGPGGGWADWLEQNFPDIGATIIYQYMRIARHKELFGNAYASARIPTIQEADRVVRFHERREKIKKQQPPSLPPDAHPYEELEAKLSRYVVGLWQLRYLETEIMGMFTALELSSEQIQQALNHVCEAHMEVKEEVMKTFSPYPRLLKPAKNS